MISSPIICGRKIITSCRVRISSKHPVTVLTGTNLVVLGVYLLLSVGVEDGLVGAVHAQDGAVTESGLLQAVRVTQLHRLVREVDLLRAVFEVLLQLPTNQQQTLTYTQYIHGHCQV